MILNETMNEIADAIREKKGTSEKIAPINFAEEIKSISAGGGESGGGRTIYVRYEKGTQSTLTAMFGSYFRVLATDGNGTAVVIGPGQFTEYMKMAFPDAEYTNAAFSLELDRRIGYGMGQQSAFFSVEEQLVQSGVDINSLTLITETEFYDLNA